MVVTLVGEKGCPETCLFKGSDDSLLMIDRIVVAGGSVRHQHGVMAAARFNVADNTNLVVNAGPYFACGIAGKTKFDLGNDTERKVDTFGDDALKRFDAGLGVGVALEFGRIIAGLDGQFGLVDVQKFGNPKNMNFSIVVGYKF